MAFAPHGAGALIILVLAVLLWGSIGPTRRRSTLDGAPFAVVVFLAEFAFVSILCVTLGNLSCAGVGGGLDSNVTVAFPGALDNRTFALTVTPGSMLVFAGGAVVGSGDLLGLVAFKHVPAAIAFPLVVGTCVAVGTFVTFLVDGSPKPGLLFGGVALAITAVVALAWGQSRPLRTSRPASGRDLADAPETEPADDDTGSTTTDDDAGDEGAPVQIAVVPVSHQKISEKEGTKEATTAATATKRTALTMSKGKWTAVLVAIGAYNSGWGPLSTIGRVGMTSHDALFAVICGRFLVQPLAQLLLSLVVRKSPASVAREMWHSTRTDKAVAVAVGCFQGGGYYCYFIGSATLNKSAAFAISNCSPLFAVFLGVVVCSELKPYRWPARLAVLLSILLFVGAIVMLSLTA